MERLLYGNGTDAFNAVVPVKIKGVFSEEKLSFGLARLQEKHPLLKAFVENDEFGRPCFIADENEANPIPVRIVPRITQSDWEGEVHDEWGLVFDVHQGPLMRVVWIRGEECSELILVMHHCICDGRSAMSILQDLLMLLENRNVSIGKEIPILSLKDIVPQEILGDRMKQLKARLHGRFIGLLVRLIPARRTFTDRKQDYMINWKLDVESSDRLIKLSKSTGTTINTLLGKTILTAFRETLSESFLNKIICPVDIRKYIPKIAENNIFSFATMVALSANEKLGFIPDAERMQKDVEKKMAALNPYKTIMQMEESHPYFEKLIGFMKGGKSSNDCIFSNLGKINIRHQYETFELETIHSPSTIGPLGKTVNIITSSFRGRMDFTFVGSEGYLAYKDALAVKEKIEEIIREL